MMWIVIIVLICIAIGLFFYFKKPKCNPDDAPTEECIREAFRENAKENSAFISSQLNTNPKVKQIPISDQQDLENILKDFKQKEKHPPSTLPPGLNIKTNKELKEMLQNQSKRFQTGITNKIDTVSASKTNETKEEGESQIVENLI
jgi:hypothetical protein